MAVSGISISLWRCWAWLKQHTIGLTEIDEYVDNHYHRDTKHNPWVTYFYFIAYEETVIAHKDKNQKTNDAGYVALSDAVRNNKKSDDNTAFKMKLHVLSLVFVLLLASTASFLSVSTLLDLIGTNNVQYPNVAFAVLFTATISAQWILFRKNVSRMFKKFFYKGDIGWHFNKPEREFEVENNALKETDKSKQKRQTPISPKHWAVFWASFFCSVLLAASLGGLMLEKGKALGPDWIGQSLAGIYFICQLFQFVSSSLDTLYRNAEINPVIENDQPVDSKKDKKWNILLYVMCGLSLFSLSCTVFSQSVSLFDSVLGVSLFDADNNRIASQAVIAGLALFTTVAALGRISLNIESQKNQFKLVKDALVNDISVNPKQYLFGAALVSVVIVTVALQAFAPLLLEGTPVSVLAVASAVTVAWFGGNKVNDWVNPASNQPVKGENHSPPNSPESSPISSSPTASPCTLSYQFTRNSMKPSRLTALAIGTNSICSASMGISGMLLMLDLGKKELPAEVQILLISFTLIAGMMNSTGTLLKNVQVENKPRPA